MLDNDAKCYKDVSNRKYCDNLQRGYCKSLRIQCTLEIKSVTLLNAKLCHLHVV